MQATEATRANHSALKAAGWYLPALCGVAILSRFLVEVADGPGQAALQLIVYASALLFGGLLLPATEETGPRRMTAILMQAAATVVLLSMIALADPVTRTATAALLPLSVTLFLLLTVGLAAINALAVRLAGARVLVFMACALLYAGPLWLAPVADAAGSWQALPSAVIAASPLSALAVALDVDYLRTAWFYRHSALGSLRYDYVSLTAYLSLFAALAAGLAIVPGLAARARKSGC